MAVGGAVELEPLGYHFGGAIDTPRTLGLTAEEFLVRDAEVCSRV
jgi:hypothetical protein